jgi:SAM-dependent methyltransferase
MISARQINSSGGGARPHTPAAWQVDKSLQLIRACGLRPDDPIIDVSGGNSSQLIEALLGLGYTDVTVLDDSESSREALFERTADWGPRVHVLGQDVIGFHAPRRYALWHDRGKFHLLTHPEERQQYLEALEEALRPEGHLVIATFGPDGPQFQASQPVRRYSAATLPAELGSHFELTEHSLDVLGSASGDRQHYLHCRFRRHAPRLV